MKTILTLLLLIVVTTSCQLKKSDNTETAVTESTEIDNAEDCTRQIRSKLLLSSGLIKQKPNTAKSTAFVPSKPMFSFVKMERSI